MWDFFFTSLLTNIYTLYKDYERGNADIELLFVQHRREKEKY